MFSTRQFISGLFLLTGAENPGSISRSAESDRLANGLPRLQLYCARDCVVREKRIENEHHVIAHA